MAVIVIVCFHCVSVGISLNFIYFIIKKRLYYLDCACKLLKTIQINIGCLWLLFFFPLPGFLGYGDLFLVLSIRFLPALLFLLALNPYVYCLDRLDLSLIEKLINLYYLKLLLLALLLPITPSCSFCLVLAFFVYIYFAYA